MPRREINRHPALREADRVVTSVARSAVQLAIDSMKKKQAKLSKLCNCEVFAKKVNDLQGGGRPLPLFALPAGLRVPSGVLPGTLAALRLGRRVGGRAARLGAAAFRGGGMAAGRPPFPPPRPPADPSRPPLTSPPLPPLPPRPPRPSDPPRESSLTLCRTRRLSPLENAHPEEEPHRGVQVPLQGCAPGRGRGGRGGDKHRGGRPGEAPRAGARGGRAGEP